MQPDPTDIRINGVVIIDALTGERNTAQKLELRLREVCDRRADLRGLYLRRRSVGSARELQSELSQLREACEQPADRALRPILHLEMHGNEYGLAVSGTDFVPWLDLRDFLVAINRATGCSLIVTLGVCSGLHIIDLVDVLEQAPFWGVISAIQPVPNLQIESFFGECYEHLLTGRDTASALASARGSFAVPPMAYALVNAREIFVGGFGQLLVDSWDVQGVEARIDRIISARVARGSKLGHDLRLRAWLRGQLTDIEPDFRLLRGRFFMAEADYTIVSRCGVRWEHVLAEALIRKGLGVAILPKPPER